MLGCRLQVAGGRWQGGSGSGSEGQGQGRVVGSFPFSLLFLYLINSIQFAAKSEGAEEGTKRRQNRWESGPLGSSWGLGRRVEVLCIH